MEFNYEKTSIDLKNVNLNIGWKQNTMIMCKTIGDYQWKFYSKTKKRRWIRW